MGTPALLQQATQTGSRPLLIACRGGHLDTARCLIAAGSDLNVQDCCKHGPLQQAAISGSVETFEFIQQLHVDTKIDYDSWALEPEEKSQAVNVELSLAVEYGHTALVQYLLRGSCGDGGGGEAGPGAEAAAASAAAATAAAAKPAPPFLALATRMGHAGVAAALLDAGADPNGCSGAGRTPLHSAAGWGHANVVELLLRAGADPSRTDAQGCTAEEVAMKSQKAKIKDLFMTFRTEGKDIHNYDDAAAASGKGRKIL